jgi:hypothetical protein
MRALASFPFGTYKAGGSDVPVLRPWPRARRDRCRRPRAALSVVGGVTNLRRSARRPRTRDGHRAHVSSEPETGIATDPCVAVDSAGDLVLGQALRDLPSPVGAVAVLGRLDVLPGQQCLQRHRLDRRASS